MPIKGITLFVFGGVAEMQDEPPSAKAEFMMSIAGPASSVVISAAFFLLYMGVEAMDFSTPVAGIMGYLGWVNIILAIFNSVPAFPLDGGRVLRSALWQWKKDIRKATRISAAIGSGFGLGLIALGVLSVIQGALIAGIWWALIGLFLRGASQMSYRQLLMRQGVEGEKVRRFMKENPVSIPPDTSLDDMVHDYVYKYHHRFYPDVEGDELVGCISTRDIGRIPHGEWNRTLVSEVVSECGVSNTISADADAVAALAKMNRTGNGRLLVVDGSRLAGIITLKDMLRFLSLKLDLTGMEAGEDMRID
jgi:CBS domain-containing protein